MVFQMVILIRLLFSTFVFLESKTDDDKDQYQTYIRELKAINERRGRIMIQVNEQGHK